MNCCECPSTGASAGGAAAGMVTGAAVKLAVGLAAIGFVLWVLTAIAQGVKEFAESVADAVLVALDVLKLGAIATLAGLAAVVIWHVTAKAVRRHRVTTVRRSAKMQAHRVMVAEADRLALPAGPPVVVQATYAKPEPIALPAAPAEDSLADVLRSVQRSASVRVPRSR